MNCLAQMENTLICFTRTQQRIANLGIKPGVCCDDNEPKAQATELAWPQDQVYARYFQLLVVPVHSNMDIFSGTVEGRERGLQFDELDCLNREMEIPDQRPEDECADLLFSMSAIIHDGANRKISSFDFLIN